MAAIEAEQIQQKKNMHRKAISKCPPTNRFNLQSQQMSNNENDSMMWNTMHKWIKKEQQQQPHLHWIPKTYVFSHVKSIDMPYTEYRQPYACTTSLICHMFYQPPHPLPKSIRIIDLLSMVHLLLHFLESKYESGVCIHKLTLKKKPTHHFFSAAISTFCHNFTKIHFSELNKKTAKISKTTFR